MAYDMFQKIETNFFEVINKARAMEFLLEKLPDIRFDNSIYSENRIKLELSSLDDVWFFGNSEGQSDILELCQYISEILTPNSICYVLHYGLTEQVNGEKRIFAETYMISTETFTKVV